VIVSYLLNSPQNRAIGDADDVTAGEIRHVRSARG
jgi:hypothetical protein